MITVPGAAPITAIDPFQPVATTDLPWSYVTEHTDLP